MYSNGIGHRVDETEFGDMASVVSPAVEVTDSRDMTQDQLPLADENTGVMIQADDSVKPVEDIGNGEQEPMMDHQSQEDLSSEHDRPAELDDIEQEAEGKMSR